LKRENVRVAVFDIVKRGLPENVPFYQGDITKKPQIDQAIQQSQATCVIHTASPLAGSSIPQQVFWTVNVDGTKTVIDSCVDNGVRALVYTSSAGVVFDGHDLKGVDESTAFPPVPMDAYNGSKAAAETLVLRANGRGALKTVALRPAGIYGPGDRQIMRNMVNVIETKKTHFQMGYNDNLFDWTYVDNVSDAHLLAADRLLSNSPGVDGEVFFITNGQPVPFWDFTRAIWRELGHVSERKPIVLPKRVAMIVAFLAEWVSWFLGKEPTFTRFRVIFTCTARWHSIAKAREILGYEPEVEVYEGVKRMVDWWKTTGSKEQLNRS